LAFPVVGVAGSVNLAFRDDGIGGGKRNQHIRDREEVSFGDIAHGLIDRARAVSLRLDNRPAQTQPVNLARRDAPPVFLATGSEDTTVLPRNSERLALALRKAGARSVSLKIYQGLGHAGTATALSPLLQWQAPVLEDVVTFLHAANVGQLHQQRFHYVLLLWSVGKRTFQMSATGQTRPFKT
jgi:acetyl esterase/lipase